MRLPRFHLDVKPAGEIRLRRRSRRSLIRYAHEHGIEFAWWERLLLPRVVIRRRIVDVLVGRLAARWPQ